MACETQTISLHDHDEELLPNIGELPVNIQQTLRKFARIAKTATEERDDALRRLQGLENLSQMLQEFQAENGRNQEQFKWYEIVLLRTEADLVRTKKRLQEKEIEYEKLHQKLEKVRKGGQSTKESGFRSIVRDQSDGGSGGTTEEQQGGPTEGDETDSKQATPRSLRTKRQPLAPHFFGISEDVHNKTLHELEETRRQLKEKVEENNMTYREYLDAKKCELQIKKLTETVDKLKDELAEAKRIDKDKISKLQEENENHREGDAMKVKVIEASNRRCQELKDEIEELRRKYQQQMENQEKDEVRRRDTDYSKNTSMPMQKLLNENTSLRKLVEDLQNQEERLMLENSRLQSEIERLKRQYDTLQDSLETEVQYGDAVASQQKGCSRCNKLAEELKRIRDVTLILESEKSATVAQMKLFEDDFHKVRDQLKFNEEKHQREMSDSMKNIQMLSQALDRSKEDMQKMRDHNQALEYQLSIVREYMKDHRPYYSVDSHPVARSGAGPVYNPGASPWQEGYRTPQRMGTLDFSDSRREIEADSAFHELKGEESEEEAELTRR